MKTIVLLLSQILFTSILFANSDCFEEKMFTIGTTINYPSIAIDNEMEEKFCFRFKTNKIVLDSSNTETFIRIFASSLDNINWDPLLNECEPNQIPESFCIDFKLGKVDTNYISNHVFTIQKRLKGTSNRYILNPAIEECQFYTNAKLKLIKGWSWKSSFNYKKGKNTVFKYLYFHAESPYWHDDEKIEGIYFQIPRGLEEFRFEDIQLLDIDLFYESICEGRCYKRNVVEGSVSGRLNHGEWIIDVSIDELNFQNKFIHVEDKK